MASQQQAFRIRWGKSALAFVGVLALIAVPVTLVIGLVTSMSLLVPVACLAVVLVSFVGLRTTAVRDRRRKAWARAAAGVGEAEDAPEQESVEADSAETDAAGENEREAEQAPAADVEHVEAPEAGKESTPAEEAASASKQAETEDAFDVELSIPTDQREAEEEAARSLAATKHEAAEETTGEETAQEAAPAAPTADEADGDETASAALAGAAASDTAASDTDTAQDNGPEARRETTWSPREIPAPTYTAAQPVERALPPALPREEEKKPVDVTSIRKAEQGRVEEQKLDLDAVLQRRRA